MKVSIKATSRLPDLYSPSVHCVVYSDNYISLYFPIDMSKPDRQYIAIAYATAKRLRITSIGLDLCYVNLVPRV